jgi:hypothetical protein
LNYEHWDVLEEDQTVVLKLLDTVEGELIYFYDDEGAETVKETSHSGDSTSAESEVGQQSENFSDGHDQLTDQQQHCSKASEEAHH